jgi:hypothetical protein
MTRMASAGCGRPQPGDRRGDPAGKGPGDAHRRRPGYACALNQTSSPLALLLLVALIAVRSVLRAAADLGGSGWHLDAVLITDCLVAFALGLLTLQRLEMYLRGLRLLREARAVQGN